MDMGICYSALCYEDLKIMIFIFFNLFTLFDTAGTAVLWWTWVMKKKALDAIEPAMQLEADQRNVTAFLGFSIAATVFTVSHMKFSNVLLNRKGEKKF